VSVTGASNHQQGSVEQGAVLVPCFHQCPEISHQILLSNGCSHKKLFLHSNLDAIEVNYSFSVFVLTVTNYVIITYENQVASFKDFLYCSLQDVSLFQLPMSLLVLPSWSCYSSLNFFNKKWYFIFTIYLFLFPNHS
jgi:hypothetical protein